METVTFPLSSDQEAAVHELLRRAYLGDGGAAVFAEIRRDLFPSPAGATLIIGLVSRPGALAIRKILEKEALARADLNPAHSGVTSRRQW